MRLKALDLVDALAEGHASPVDGLSLPPLLFVLLRDALTNAG